MKLISIKVMIIFLIFMSKSFIFSNSTNFIGFKFLTISAPPFIGITFNKRYNNLSLGIYFSFADIYAESQEEKFNIFSSSLSGQLKYYPFKSKYSNFYFDSILSFNLFPLMVNNRYLFLDFGIGIGYELLLFEEIFLNFSLGIAYADYWSSLFSLSFFPIYLGFSVNYRL